jgi:hypothetical protein
MSPELIQDLTEKELTLEERVELLEMLTEDLQLQLLEAQAHHRMLSLLLGARLRKAELAPLGLRLH